MINIKRFSLVLVLGGIGLAAILGLQRRHPEFGQIYKASISEHPGPLAQAITIGKKMVGLHVLNKPDLFMMGSSPLQWSTGGGVEKGFIYLNHPLLNDTPLWEFALCEHRQLADVCRDDLKAEFYGMNDSRGSNVFGADWHGHAIRVPVGQVFLARVVGDASLVYVIRVAKHEQSNGRTTIEYVTVTNTPPNKPHAANSRHVTQRRLEYLGVAAVADAERWGLGIVAI
jgi:hypothetical protein